MALVSTSIPNLLNGVSQQPSSLRQVTQGETQVNALSSVIDGLVKRPPTEHIKEVLSSAITNAAIHVVDRGEGKRDVFVAYHSPVDAVLDENGGVETAAIYDRVLLSVFNIDTGTEVTLSGQSDNLEYIYCINPAEELKFITVNDYTLVVNTTKTPAYTSATSGNAGDTETSTKYNDFSDLPDGHLIGNGGTGEATVNRKYILLGADGNNFDSYYVKCVNAGESATAYEETIKTNIKYKLDPLTMPQKITPSNTTPTTYSLDAITWGERTCGDEDSAPDPSFIGQKINNIFFYKNRLGFLSGENVIFSAAGDFFRFFPETVTTVLADNPIDVTTTHTKAAVLKQAVAFNDSLTLFSDNTQFTIENAGNLTPQTISIIPTTEFENDAKVAPVGAGNFLYFVSKKGDYSSVREYFIEADTVITDALEITAHVPKYIPKNVTKLTTSSNEDTLVALSSEDRSKLYVYKWFSDGQQKLQSSWSTWQLPSGASVMDISIIESQLYLVVSRSDGTSLEKIDLQVIDDSGLSFCSRLDRKTTLTGTYDSVADVTTWTLPYEYTGDVVVVKGGTWSSHEGANITSSRPSIYYEDALKKVVYASGDYSASPVLIGIPYTMTYQFSTQHIKEKNSTQSVQSGRLQLRTMRVNFENTGFFKVQVTPEARQTYEYEYTGVTLNQAGSVIGDVILNDGTFRFPIQSKNDRVAIQIVSDSYLPCAFQNAEWEGFYNIRSKRI